MDVNHLWMTWNYMEVEVLSFFNKIQTLKIWTHHCKVILSYESFKVHFHFIHFWNRTLYKCGKNDPHHLIVRQTRKICRNLSHFVITTPLILIWVCTFSFQQNVNTINCWLWLAFFQVLDFSHKTKKFQAFFGEKQKETPQKDSLTRCEKIFLYTTY